MDETNNFTLINSSQIIYLWSTTLLPSLSSLSSSSILNFNTTTTIPTIITKVIHKHDGISENYFTENYTINNNNNNNNYNNSLNNYWALLAIVLVFGTAAGNILVCLAIAWERRLQNVTNYFLMSLAITDLMVAILVMPLGILTLVKGYFPLQSEHCLAWICLDVLFCTASIMHLCTISIDRYLSLRYPMRFGRNKTRKRVTVKIIFVWLLSIAMSLPLSLMYSKDHASVLVEGTCQIPDPVYKLVGSIICFYIPLIVMLITYYLTVRLLARQRQNLGGGNQQTNSGWAVGWLGQAPQLERRCTWRKLLKTTLPSTPNHAHSAASTDTELSTLDTHELWLQDSSLQEPTPSTMTALHQFGAEMVKLSRGLESVSSSILSSSTSCSPQRSIHISIDQQQQHPFLYQQSIPTIINRISPSPPSTSILQDLQLVAPSSLPTPPPLPSPPQPLISSLLRPQLSISTAVTSSTSNFAKIWQRKRRASYSTIITTTSSTSSNNTATPKQIFQSPDILTKLSPIMQRKRYNSLPLLLSSKTLLPNSESDSSTSLPMYTNNNNNNSNMEKFTIELSKEKDSKNNERFKPKLLLIDKITMNDNKKIGIVNAIVDDNTEKIVAPSVDDLLILPPPCTCPYFGERPAVTTTGTTTSTIGRELCALSLTSSSCLIKKQTAEIEIKGTSLGIHRSSIANNLLPDKIETISILSTTIAPTAATIASSSSTSAVTPITTTSSSLSSKSYLQLLSTSPMLQHQSFQQQQQLQPQESVRKLSYSKTNSIVTWNSRRNKRRGSSFGGVRTSLLLTPTKIPMSSSNGVNNNNNSTSPLRRSATLRNHNNVINNSNNNSEKNIINKSLKIPSSACLLQRSATIRSHHSRNASVISRNSSRHGRIIRLEQKATKVLGVVFFTFVILWAPFFVLNLLPTVCGECENNISHWVFDIVTWLGYASSMVNPIFYTIFNKIFRQAFKKVLLCKYTNRSGGSGSRGGRGVCGIGAGSSSIGRCGGGSATKTSIGLRTPAPPLLQR